MDFLGFLCFFLYIVYRVSYFFCVFSSRVSYVSFSRVSYGVLCFHFCWGMFLPRFLGFAIEQLNVLVGRPKGSYIDFLGVHI